MLSLILTFKQQFIKYINGKYIKLNKLTLKTEPIIFKRINLIKRFWCQIVKSWQKNCKEIDIYYIGYITFKIANCNNINSINPLYLMINEMIGHFEWKNGNKYLVLDDVDENKEVLKKYEEVWEGIKKEIETINGGDKIEYGKDF